MVKIQLKLKNGKEYGFIGELEKTKVGYKIIEMDGSGIEIYEDIIEELEITDINKNSIQPLGEIESNFLERKIQRYKEYEYDKIERMR